MGIIDILTYSPFPYNLPVGILSAICGIALFSCFLYECKKHYGWSPSISKYFYKCREIFQMFMYASSLFILGIGQNVTYAVVALLFTIMAMFPSVMDKHFLIPHCICASLAIIIGLLGLLLFNIWTGCIICMSVILWLMTLTIERNWHYNPFLDDTFVYWAEVISISYMIFGLVLLRICWWF